MIDMSHNTLSPLAWRYKLDESEEWENLIRHFELAGEGFHFIVLLVPDTDGAEICRRTLEEYLGQHGKLLRHVPLEAPESLKTLAATLLDLDLPKEAAAIWVSATSHQTIAEIERWKSAWREGAARLNQVRNALRSQINVTLIFAGVPWLQEILRVMAPDLWSVRTLVVSIIQPQPTTDLQQQPTTDFQQRELWDNGASFDPELALREAEKLRGQPGEAPALAKMLLRAGEGLMNRQGNNQPAMDALAEAVTLFQQSGLKQEEAAALNRLGTVSLRLGDVTASAASFECALHISHELGDRLSEAGALANLGIAYGRLGGGSIRKAIEYHERHLAIAREVGDRRGEVAALNNLGNAFAKLGERRKAIELYEQCLVIAREIGYRSGESAALGSLGVAYATLGAVREAIEFIEQALTISRKLGDRRGEVISLWNLALALDRLGERERAIEYAEAALGIYEKIEAPAAAKVRDQLAEWRGQS